MKLSIFAIVFAAIIPTLSLSAASAQTPQPAVAADQPTITKSVAPPKKSPRPKTARLEKEGADARICLDFPTELMIIQCAEKYRFDKRGR